MTQGIPLSVLDLAPVPAGGTAADALRNTVDLAQVAERSGYRRYWVAEHHLTPGVASAQPAVLIALLAGVTDRIRLGSGAVQLPNTPTLSVAEQFGTISALHPGRIDLGLGRFDLRRILDRRAGGSFGGPPIRPTHEVDGLVIPEFRPYSGDQAVYQLLGELLDVRLDEPAPDYARQIAEIRSFLAGTHPGPGGRPVTVLPAQGADPELWVLGTTPGESARAAGEAGLPFAASYHIVPNFVLETVEAYRAAFRPSEILDRPYLMVSADVVVADDDETAAELALPYAQWVLDVKSGRGAQPYVTPEQARRRVWTDEERDAVRDRLETHFVGSPATVAERLRTLARVTGADELLVTSITTEHADRVRSHELLAKHWVGG
jgi:alkanesulfonate monooxygenase SsuD/methylene tetrahydromethanopterin reductase-like flavin-dependent oxidoreductase (luciferase family)